MVSVARRRVSVNAAQPAVVTLVGSASRQCRERDSYRTPILRIRTGTFETDTDTTSAVKYA